MDLILLRNIVCKYNHCAENNQTQVIHLRDSDTEMLWEHHVNMVAKIGRS